MIFFLYPELKKIKMGDFFHLVAERPEAMETIKAAKKGAFVIWPMYGGVSHRFGIMYKLPSGTIPFYPFLKAGSNPYVLCSGDDASKDTRIIVTCNRAMAEALEIVKAPPGSVVLWEVAPGSWECFMKTIDETVHFIKFAFSAPLEV